MLAIGLALVAALGYGVSDFIGGLASRRVNPWVIALGSQVSGLILVGGAAVLFGGQPTLADFAWGSAAGVANTIGTVGLYQGIRRGRIGIVAPISEVGTALVPLFLGLVVGERPGVLAWLGVLVAFPGIWLVAREPGGAVKANDQSLRYGLIAAAGFGFLLALLSRIPEQAGLLPVAWSHLVAGVFLLTLAMVLHQPVFSSDPAAFIGLGAGCLAALALVSFLVASQQGFVSISAVITALYPGVTVLLAATLLHERLARSQIAGLGLCGLTVAMVALG